LDGNSRRANGKRVTNALTLNSLVSKMVRKFTKWGDEPTNMISSGNRDHRRKPKKGVSCEAIFHCHRTHTLKRQRFTCFTKRQLPFGTIGSVISLTSLSNFSSNGSLWNCRI
uniref:Ovule protein n=1 Tax=Gongylonema pulchrum TaxID=637853 RepID=A0A183EWM3_9BILA